MKYYAVKKGRHPGIYTTWIDCQKEVDHFKDAKFKSFDSKKEALAYLKQNNQKSSLHSKQETTNSVVIHNLPFISGTKVFNIPVTKPSSGPKCSNFS